MIVLWAAAWAASLEVRGTCDAAMRFEAAGLRPGERVTLRASDVLVPAAAAGTCAGMMVDVGTGARRFGAVADEVGVARWEVPEGKLGCDSVVQVVRPEVCETVAPVDLRSEVCRAGALVTSAADAAVLERCRAIDALVVDGALERVSFPELVVVRDLAVFGADSLERVELPELVRVRGMLNLVDMGSAAVGAPSLQRVGSLWMTGMDVGALFAPRLARVSYAIDVDGWGDLVLPALREAGEITVAGLVGKVELPLLGEVHTLQVLGSSLLTVLALPSAWRIGGVSSVEDNASLAEVDLSALREVDDLRVVDNPRLCPTDGSDGWPSWADVTFYAALWIGGNAAGCHEVGGG